MFFLRIHLYRLRVILGAGKDGQPVTNDDAFEWLTGRGFRVGRIGWYAPGSALAELDHRAILHCERII